MGVRGGAKRAFFPRLEIGIKNQNFWCACDQCAWVSNFTYAGLFSCSIKLRDLLEYIYAGLWEYVSIVKV